LPGAQAAIDGRKLPMKSSLILPVRYQLLTFRLDQLWLPGALWALFAIVTAFMRASPSYFSVATAYLGFVLPLIGGVMGAYAVLDDFALELQMTTPRPPWALVIERLVTIFVIQALAALSFQIYLAAVGVDLAPLGGLLARQAAWAVPSLACITLGSALSFGFAQCLPAAMVTALVWLTQLLLRDGFQADPIGRFIFLFLGVRDPLNPVLPGNQLCLSGLAILFFLVAVAFFKHQERYL
jgi:hypothetical protein